MKKQPDQNIVLGIDIGGTGIKTGFVEVNTGKLISKKIKFRTPQPATPESVFLILNQVIKKYNWEGDIGAGFPGVVKKGQVHFVGNLDKSWIGENVERGLRKYTTGRVKVINDADAAALAEMKFGAGKKYNHHFGGVVLVVTLGTGIGSALFLNGYLLPNTEFGQIEMNGKIAEKLAAAVIREKENLSWKRWGKRINSYLHMVEMLLSPDLIIIGGGVSNNPDKFFRYIDVHTKFVAAKMGNDAGIVGAALAINSI